ncbi:hypothetical protein B7P33_08580 [Sediminicola luteus]|uniref:Uncharacterized protein n=1 Tax=Sediminicola luteus TaxID=319238 RepID=A0A2A4G7D0_9FLAO|nr:hypothetical protein B7P33_08580 [Sediminicola luteus]
MAQVEINSIEDLAELDIFETIVPTSAKPSTGYFNETYIEQIGQNSTVQVTTDTDKSNITVLQKGADNQFALNVVARSYNGLFVQIGNQHRFSEYMNNPSQIIETQLLQEGSGQQLIIHNRNSLSDGLKIKMSGESQSVVIRNFN